VRGPRAASGRTQLSVPGPPRASGGRSVQGRGPNLASGRGPNLVSWPRSALGSVPGPGRPPPGPETGFGPVRAPDRGPKPGSA
jgi:hypothetical protein